MNSDIESSRNLFEVPSLPLLYPSVLAGNQPAQLWHNDTSGLLWDMSYKRYLGGEGNGEIASLLLANIEEWLAQGNPMAVVVPLTEAWKSSLPTMLGKYKLYDEVVNVYRYSHGRPTQPNGYRLVPIDRAVIEISAPVREEVEHMWGQLDRFLKRGFGWAALFGEEVVAWCTAEYLSDDRVGVGAETLPGHRRNGLSSALARLYGETGRERGLDVYWECNTLNLHSNAVACKAGYEWVGNYPIVVIERLHDRD